MFQYLQALGLLAGYIASLFALAGWAWFQRFFKELGVNVDAINYDGTITRIDYYIRPGAEAIRRLIIGDLWKNLRADITQEKFILNIFAVGFILLLYFYVRIRIYNRKIRQERDEKLKQESDLLLIEPPNGASDSSPIQGLNFNFLSVAASVFFILTLSILGIKAGEWTAIQDARRVSSDSLPRVQILFKKDTSSSAIKNLENIKLRKIYMDRANIYVFAEEEVQETGLPPIYVISLSEISQIRLELDLARQPVP